MIINFDNVEEKNIPHFNQGEGEFIAKILVDENCKILHGVLKTGCSIGYHKHSDSSEIIYILSGEGKVLFDDSVEFVKAGQVHYCPKGHAHSLINENTEDLVFFAVVPFQ